MAQLQQQAFDKIASALGGLKPSSYFGAVFTLNKGKYNEQLAVGTSGGTQPLWKWLEKLSPDELAWIEANEKASNFNAVTEFIKITYAIEIGLVTVAEGEAYLATLNPTVSFGGSLTKYDKASAGVEIEGQQASTPSESPDKLDPVDEAQQVQAAIGAGPLAAASDPTIPFAIVVPDMPSNYDADEVQSALEDMAEQFQQLISAPQPTAAPNSIPGWALIAGSVPASKLDPITTNQQLLKYPAPEDSIELTIAPSSSVDRWAGSGQPQGPGRVWQVQSYKVPTGWTPTSGIVRYRIVVKGMQFGVMSIAQDEPWPVNGSILPDPLRGMSICYGSVLRGLPWFGSTPPRGIIMADYAGDPPASLVLNKRTGAPYEEEATAFFDTSPPTGFESMAVTPGSFIDPGSTDWNDYVGSPTPTYAESVSGFGFHLITGQEVEDVYSQLNGRPDSMFPHLGLAPCAPSIAIPNHLSAELEPLATVALVQSTSSGEFYSRTPDSIVDGGDVFCGAPFLWEDCAKLKASTGSFSLAVQVLPFRRFPTGFTNRSTWRFEADTPLEAWPLTGLKVIETGHRDWSVDILVV